MVRNFFPFSQKAQNQAEGWSGFPVDFSHPES
jgi:hypothetical protein